MSGLVNEYRNTHENSIMWAHRSSPKAIGVSAVVRVMEAGSVTERKSEWFCMSCCASEQCFPATVFLPEPVLTALRIRISDRYRKL